MAEPRKRMPLNWALIAIIALALVGAALYLSAIFGGWMGMLLHGLRV